MAALVGTIEFLAVDESATVVAEDCVFRSGLRSGARRQDFVLQTARKRDDVLFRFVRGEECLALFFICRGNDGEFRFLLLFHFAGKCGESGLRLLVGEEKFAAGEAVLDAAGDDGGIEVHAFFFHAFANVCADGVASFFTVCGERRGVRWSRGRSGAGLFGCGAGLGFRGGGAGGRLRFGGRCLR